MEQTRGLELTQARARMAQRGCDGHTHAGGSKGVRFIIPANRPLRLSGMRPIVTFQKRGNLRPGEHGVGGFQNGLGDKG